MVEILEELLRNIETDIGIREEHEFVRFGFRWTRDQIEQCAGIHTITEKGTETKKWHDNWLISVGNC